MTEVTILHANSYDGEEYALRLEIIETIPVTKRDKFSEHLVNTSIWTRVGARASHGSKIKD